MILIMSAVLIALAVLGPLFGADSRDGLNWVPSRRQKLR
jgi:hypothetical protein